MGLLQPSAAIYHHPLDSALTNETVKGIAWIQTGGTFGVSKVADGFQPASGEGDMTGAGGSYDTTVGSAKLAFTSWLRDPSSSVPSAGYASSGFERPAILNVTTIDKLDFSTDAVATITSGISTARRAGVGGFENSAAGYACGGFTTAFASTIDKLLFADDSVAAITSGLTTVRIDGAAGFSDTAAGYACGGVSGSPTIDNILTTIDKLTFSTESVALNSAGLSDVRRQGVGLGFESATAGYISGGGTAGGAVIGTIEKLTFSTDSVANIAGQLSIARRLGVAAFAASDKGYTCGGFIQGSVGDPTARIDKLTFSTDSVVANSSSLSGTRAFGVAGFESGVGGYACGGDEAIISGVPLTTIDKLVFSTDAVAVNSSGLTGTRSGGLSGFASGRS